MIVALVGMCGSGKTEAAAILSETGVPTIRFGDATMIELEKQGMEVNPANEKLIREQLRNNLGMDAFAKVNEPRIKEALRNSGSVVIDGLYSWEEYLYLKQAFGDDLVLLQVYASPKTRQERLAGRELRPLTPEECLARDKAEIENINKGGPIAIADHTVVNEGSMNDLKDDVESFARRLLDE